METFCAGNSHKFIHFHLLNIFNKICYYSHIQKQKGVTFAGYKMPHPLEHKFVIKVQTEKPLTPSQALEKTVDKLIADLASLEERFRVKLRLCFNRYLLF